MPLRKGRIDDDTAAEDAKWDGLKGIVAWGCGEDCLAN